jgi:hypothetical protein
MFQRLRDAIRPSKGRSLGGAFYRLGWAGFWLQVVFGSLPVIGIAYFLTFSRSDMAPRGEFGFVEYLTLFNLVLLLFTTIWSYRYTRVGRRILDPERRPSESSLLGTVWTGVLASTVGMLFSMIVILIEAANLLFFFLKSPQAGVPVIQTSGAQAAHWVSSVDMLSLMTLILVLFAELLVLVFSLWLLFRMTLGSPEFPQPTAPEDDNKTSGLKSATASPPVAGAPGSPPLTLL